MKGYKSQNTSPIWMYLTLVVLAFFLIFIAYPLSLVLYRSFYNQQTQTLTLEYFTRFFTRKYFTNTIINSFKVTFSATIVSSILGLTIAYITRSSKIKGSKWLNILIVVSYLSPPFIGAYAWIQLLGRNGLITKYINAWFGMNFEGIYGFIGIVLVFSLQSFPLVYMYVAGALKNLDNSLNEAAESLGSSTLQRISMVIMPLIVPTLLASSLLVFMRVFSDFGTPMLIGEGYRTFPVVLYSQFMGEVAQDDNFAAALCIIIMIITLVFFFAQRMIARKMSYSMTALKPMQAIQKKGLTNVLQHVFVYFVVFLGILPQLTVIATSFMEFSGGHVFTGRLTLENFRNTLLNKGSNAVWNTYLFGISAILIVVVLGIIISYLAVRKSSF
ncbi:MAG: iron ABC transporter permease, partial [Eubacteriales bacterium]|nr:iron ABC transporter permease [Eubacteriales bacterium]